jgi:hypothetical protein
MANYLLLRDNKESGPYTMDELLNFGLKPYDLVWVQGKSAAWRYPSEVEELKPYSPVVEEQPYDRFYKKGTEEKKGEIPPASQNNYTQAREEDVPLMNEYSRYIPAEKKEEKKFTPKKSVFVTLPGQEQVVPEKNSQPAQALVQPAITSSATSARESAAEAEIKYSQPLDEIKERYVKTLLERKDKKAKKGLIINWLKKAAVFAGLIMLGVLAGFVIKSKPGKDEKVVQQLLQASPLVNNAGGASSPAYIQQDEIPAVKAPVEKIVNDDPLEPMQKIKEGVRINEEQEPTTVRIRKETMLIVPKEKETGSARPFSHEPVETDPLTGERNRKLRNNNNAGGNEEKAVMKSGKNGLYDLVSVASNDYKRVAFGGIRNLYLTVTNNSKYELDNVIVELQYLKPSEEPLRTENIKFRSVAPNASATIRVPDTNRGIKISYKIITIDSKQNSDAVAGR